MDYASRKLLPSGHRDRDAEPLFRRRALALTKRSVRSIVRARPSERRVVLIFGCQRSGTTMLQQTFLDRSWRRAHPRGTRSPSGRTQHGPEETTWQEYSTVLGRIRRLPFEVVAAKPLVESASATALMDAAGAVKAVWMLRHYREVARSNVSRFGVDNPYRDLQPIRSRDVLDWRYKRCDRGNLGDGHHLDESMANPARRGRAVLVDPQPALLRPAPLEGRPDPGPALRTSVQPARRGDPIPFRPTSDWRCPSGSIASRVRAQPFPPETGELDPDIERLCAKLWDSFEGRPEL